MLSKIVFKRKKILMGGVMKLGRGVKIHSKTSVPASPHVKSLISDYLRSRKPVICNFLNNI